MLASAKCGRVLHADAGSYDPETLELLRRAADKLRIVDPDDLVDALRGYEPETLFVGLGSSVDGRVLELAPALACVVTPTTSHNHLALPELAARGVRVLSLQGRMDLLHDVTATAELTWALALCLTRRLREANARSAEGSWSRAGLMGVELRGRTLGVIGLGRVGAAVARVGAAFGMTVRYADVVDKPAAAEIPASRSELSDLFATSDIVTIHASLGPDATAIISRRHIQRMRQDAILINTAQGELMDEAALADAVAAERICAAVDVLQGDSRWTTVPAGHRLLALAARTNRLLVTPHIGGYSDRSVALVRHRLVTEYIDWAQHREDDVD